MPPRPGPTPARAPRGVTLIELMVTVAVLAVALSLAAPTFTQQFANFRVRSAAEGMINGLNLARAEAVRRNSPVSFSLDSAGAGWSVAQVSPASTILSRPQSDTAGVTATSSTSSRTVTFTPTGMVDGSGTRLEQITLTHSGSSTDQRQIDILGGGLIRVCDPRIVDTGDPRKC